MAENEHSCKQCREWMMDILYPEDLDHLPAGIEKHVDACRECGEELKALKGTLSMIRSVDLKIRPPAGLEDRIISAIDREVGGRPAMQPAVGFFSLLGEKIQRALQAARPVVMNPAFAAAMIVLVIGGFLLFVKDAIRENPWSGSEQESGIVVSPVPPEEEGPPGFILETAPREAKVAAQEVPAVGAAEVEGKEERAKARAPAIPAIEDTVSEGDGELAAALKAKAKIKTIDKTKELEYPGPLDLETSGGGKKGKATTYFSTPFVDDGVGPGMGPGGKAGDTSAGESNIEIVSEKVPEGAAQGGGTVSNTVSGMDVMADKKSGYKYKPAEEMKVPATKKKAPPPPVTTGSAASTPAPTPAPSAPSSVYDMAGEAEEADSLMAYEAMVDHADMSPPKKSKEGKKKGWLARWKEKKKAATAKKKKAGSAKAAKSDEDAYRFEKNEKTLAEAAQPASQKKDPYALARDYYQDGDYDKALKVLNAVLKSPSSTTTGMAYVYHLLGKVWNKKGKKSKALVYYENLFTRYPSYAYINQARWEAALLYIATGEKSQAGKLLEKLLKSSKYKDKARKKLDSL